MHITGTQPGIAVDVTILKSTTLTALEFSNESIDLFQAVLNVLREVWKKSRQVPSAIPLFSEVSDESFRNRFYIVSKTIHSCCLDQFTSGDERCLRFDLASGDIRPVPLTGNPKSLQKARIYKIPEGYRLSLFKGGSVHLDFSGIGHHAMSDGYGPCIQIVGIKRDPANDCVDVTHTVHWAEPQENSGAFSSDISSATTCPSQVAFSDLTQNERGERLWDVNEKPTRDYILPEFYRLLQELHEEHHRLHGRQSFFAEQGSLSFSVRCVYRNRGSRFRADSITCFLSTIAGTETRDHSYLSNVPTYRQPWEYLGNA